MNIHYSMSELKEALLSAQQKLSTEERASIVKELNALVDPDKKPVARIAEHYNVSPNDLLKNPNYKKFVSKYQDDMLLKSIDVLLKYELTKVESFAFLMSLIFQKE